MCIVLGLDISTKTGYAVLRFDGSGAFKSTSGVLTSTNKGFSRLGDLATGLISVIDNIDFDLIVIEGYGFGNKHTLVTLVEVGTVLRYFLWQRGLSYIEVAPTSLKKFVTGKGIAHKELMLKEVYKRWGHDVSSNDEADALALAYIGMFLCGVDVGLPKANTMSIEKIFKTNLQLIAN